MRVSLGWKSDFRLDASIVTHGVVKASELRGSLREESLPGCLPVRLGQTDFDRGELARELIEDCGFCRNARDAGQQSLTHVT